MAPVEQSRWWPSGSNPPPHIGQVVVGASSCMGLTACGLGLVVLDEHVVVGHGAGANATTCEALTARQWAWVGSFSLSALARPPGRQPGCPGPW